MGGGGSGRWKGKRTSIIKCEGLWRKVVSKTKSRENDDVGE